MPTLTRAARIGKKFQNPVQTSIGGFGMMFKVLPLYLANKEERVPLHALGPFRTNPRVYENAPVSGLRVTWMGHSSMLIEIDGVRVLTDPVWDERAAPVTWAGPKRFFKPPLPLEELPPLDVVLISHNHYDHLGKQTIKRLARLDAARNARWLTSLGVAANLHKFVVRANVEELDWTQSVSLGEKLEITAIPARHFSGRGFSDRFESLWSSFVLKGNRHCVYFGADSGLWDGFSEIGAKYGPFHLTMLEVGAYNDLWKSIHMGPDGAAEAFAAMNSGGLLMPIHWGLFDLALHAWRQPIERITELADTLAIKLWSPTPGVPTDVIAGEEFRSDWWRKTAL